MKRRGNRKGFSLVEVTVALAIAAFCLTSVLALIPVGLASYRESSWQTAAANLATSVEADLRAVPPDSTASSATPFYGITLSGTKTLYLNDDSSICTNPSKTIGAVYHVSVTVTPPPDDSRAASTASINITCAAGNNSTATMPTVYETVMSLDRN
jgi:uncharacterized protein (TIGR02598 family)